jgi:hypothetical protein
VTIPSLDKTSGRLLPNTQSWTLSSIEYVEERGGREEKGNPGMGGNKRGQDRKPERREQGGKDRGK